MPPLVGHRLQILKITARTRVIRRFWQRTAGRRMLPHLGLRVGIVFAEFQTRSHVQHLAHGGVAEGRLRQFRHIVGHLAVRIELALSHQGRPQDPDHGFRHRHGAMLSTLVQDAEIALVDDTATVQHQYAIRVTGGQRLLPGHRVFRAQRHKAQAVDIAAQRARQGHRRAQAARHIHRRHQLAKVRHAPAQLRKMKITAIVEADDFIGWRRCTHHPAQTGRIAGGGRQRRWRGFSRLHTTDRK
ncbi:MAG: hypothetical protein RLZZ237_772 [Pseudomonadota bacterium]